MAQVGPLREYQDIMDNASACLDLIWSPIRRKLPFACVSGNLCIAKCLRSGGLLQCRWGGSCIRIRWKVLIPIRIGSRIRTESLTISESIFFLVLKYYFLGSEGTT
jgi:hypothetical protein